jgi:hypothetical protein
LAWSSTRGRPFLCIVRKNQRGFRNQMFHATNDAFEELSQTLA